MEKPWWSFPPSSVKLWIGKSFVDISSETFKFFTVRNQDTVNGYLVVVLFLIFLKIKSVLSVDSSCSCSFSRDQEWNFGKNDVSSLFHVRFLLDWCPPVPFLCNSNHWPNNSDDDFHLKQRSPQLTIKPFQNWWAVYTYRKEASTPGQCQHEKLCHLPNLWFRIRSPVQSWIKALP